MTRDIPERESLTVEFKSDRARLADRDLIAAVICLANTEGGEIYLGVEDDGRVTGLHPAHQSLTGLTALIANLTSPPLTARVEAIDVEPHRIARISVPKSRQLVATSDGLLQRRRLRADGLPECVEIGLFRVPVPNYEPRAFREALVNALVHRDYTRLGAVHVRWEADAIVVSNPGGFVDGVTLDNLLVVEPRPRNPLLADAVKRIGLAERTGRGIDLIFQGLLRYGRPAPDYGRSDSQSVVVVLPGGDADLDVLRIVIDEENRLGHPLPIDSMVALALLRHERRIDTNRLAREIQRDEAAARKVVERLVEAGLVVAHGIKKGRTYTLSSNVYKALGQPADYVRQVGFDPIQQEQMVLQFAASNGRITRKQVSELCRISEDQAGRLLKKLLEGKRLRRTGKGRTTAYEPY